MRRVLALALLLAACSGTAAATSTSTTVAAVAGTDPPATTTTARATTTTARVTTTTRPTTTTAALPIIESGVYFVGSEIAPGLYRVAGYWARLDQAMEIIDNDLIGDNGIGLLNVRETDAFIEISGEAIAVADFTDGVVSPQLNGYTEGTYLVGIDIEPGTYRITPVAADDSAYWARLDESGDIIDNGLSEGQLIAVVQPSDWAFSFTGELEQG